MVTTLASYATAPRTSGLASFFIARSERARSEQALTRDRLADEIVQGVRGGSHDRRRARIAERALDRDVVPEGGPAAHAHGEVADLGRALARRGLGLEHAQRRV